MISSKLSTRSAFVIQMCSTWSSHIPKAQATQRSVHTHTYTHTDTHTQTHTHPHTHTRKQLLNVHTCQCGNRSAVRVRSSLQSPHCRWHLSAHIGGRGAQGETEGGQRAR